MIYKHLLERTFVEITDVTTYLKLNVIQIC